MTRTVSFATLGCRLNQVDTQALQAELEQRGFRTVPFEEPADVVVVNSCTVTARAEFSDRQMVRRATRVSPRARVVVTGCWAQTDPQAVAGLDGVDLVAGNGDKRRLPALIEELLATPRGGPGARVQVSDIADMRTLAPSPLGRITGRSRAFLKVQEGCQHRCAFCIVPLARGPSRSLEPDAIVAQVRLLVEGGHPEVVLTGVDLGHYGADLVPRRTLAGLLRRLVDIPGLRWVRLSSLLPAYFTPELIELVGGSPAVAPHLHIPLQSGSDRILRLMRRPYTSAMYRSLIERLSRAIPSLALGTDVIAGFPGETEDDFARTVRLVDDLPFAYLHVFPYSDRRGTEATRLPGRVPAGTVAARSRALRERSRARNLAFRSRLLGSLQEALVLDTPDRQTGAFTGLTGNYVEVVFPGPTSLARRLVRVRVTALDGDRTLGELAEGAAA